jgi:hypothetical protein
MKRAILIIIFAALVGIGAYLAPIISDDPVASVAAALRNLDATEDVAVELTVGMSVPAAEVDAAAPLPFIPVILSGLAYVDMPRKEVPSAHGAFSIVGAKNEAGENSIVEVRLASDGTAYMKLDDLPHGAAFDGIVDLLDGKWTSIESWKLASLLLGRDAVNADRVAATPEAAAENWTRIRALVTGGELFALKERAVNRPFDGKPSRRYVLTVLDEPAVELVEEVDRLILGRYPNAEERAAILRAVSERETTATVWIDKETGEMRKLDLVIKPKAGVKDARPVNVTIEFGARNAVDSPFERPEGAIPFIDLLEQARSEQ